MTVDVFYISVFHPEHIMRHAVFVALTFVSPCLFVSANQPADTPVATPVVSVVASVESRELGEIYNLYQCGPLLMAGQPTVADIGLLAKEGVKTIVTFRKPGEIQWDEKSEVEKNGLKYLEFPFAAIEELTDEVFNESRKLLCENGDTPILLHCGAAIRVAAVWLPYRVLDQEIELEIALLEAEKMGLKSPKLRERAVKYIESQR
jgi:protein tyrosine phosphatase (PTP) superfamily phosphohydrolase (DUF442 family)